MRRSLLTALALALIASLSSAPALRAQSCISIAEFDSTGAYLLGKVRTLTAPRDTVYDAARRALGLPLVAAANVTLVTQSSICSKAAAAYAAKIAGAGGGLTGRVLVVKAGTMYVVLDPNYYLLASNKQYRHMVMDSKFKAGESF